MSSTYLMTQLFPESPHVAQDPLYNSSMPCAHHSATLKSEKTKLAYQLAITFGHITFGRTAGVLSILTRPLHCQRTIPTEGVDQAS